MKFTICRWCSGDMVIHPTLPTENEVYMIEHYHAKFTGKYYHEDCFFEMMRSKFNVVNPDEL